MENKQQGRLLGLRGAISKLGRGVGRRMASSCTPVPSSHTYYPSCLDSGKVGQLVGEGLPSMNP